ncbi:MAG TPA: hypothetical protein VL128_01285 [Candidatus Eisenbacteria bacterium]|nr:hypothetical protein [Candidatus Eisenbacteria bacterium]
MSNLSFARIMYGASQDHSNSAWMPVSNFPSHLSPSTDGSSALPLSSSAKRESFLHKAWHALTRHS